MLYLRDSPLELGGGGGHEWYLAKIWSMKHTILCRKYSMSRTLMVIPHTIMKLWQLHQQVDCRTFIHIYVTVELELYNSQLFQIPHAQWVSYSMSYDISMLLMCISIHMRIMCVLSWLKYVNYDNCTFSIDFFHDVSFVPYTYTQAGYPILYELHENIIVSITTRKHVLLY